MNSSLQSFIEGQLSQQFGSSHRNFQFRALGGGCINQCYQLESSAGSFFCKTNSAVKFPQLFEKERQGLEALRTAGIRTPQVIGQFEWEDQQLLILEWIGQGERTGKFWEDFGERLALLHQHSHENFGWQEDNFMGSIPQSNGCSDNWKDFLLLERLAPLVKQCFARALLEKKHLDAFGNLFLRLTSIFDKDQKPALVHGDLWSGNFMCDELSAVVLIDPAVYFGHPAVDLGMTTLFGGFDPRFYEAYSHQSPFPTNHKQQWAICNLYPLLVHLLLFGPSYLFQIEITLKSFS